MHIHLQHDEVQRDELRESLPGEKLVHPDSDSDSPDSDGPNPWKDLVEAEEATSWWNYVKLGVDTS